jgi:hypothetical protein
MIVSEHRASYANTDEMEDISLPDPDITLYAISSTRFEVANTAAMLRDDGIRSNIVHICWLKPFMIDERVTHPLMRSRVGMVIDAGHEICGAAQSLAYSLSQETGYRVAALGLEDKTKCLCEPLQNKAPDAQRIYLAVKKLIESDDLII